MDQKPRNLSSGSVRKMDGLGPSKPQAKSSGAPLDLRRSEPAKPKPTPASERPVSRPAGPSSQESPVISRPKAQTPRYDDPLEDLLNDSPAADSDYPLGPQLSQPQKPKKKGGFWKKFRKFVAVLLVIAFMASIGLFVYFTFILP